MLSEFSSSFCFMGVSSNSAVLLSDKDLNAIKDPEFGVLVRPAMEIHEKECQTSIPEDHELVRLKQLSVQRERDQEKDKDHQEEQQEQRNIINVTAPVAPLKLKKLEIPSYNDVVGSEKDDSNDGFKTPTSSDHKIPAILECPHAPKKTKSRPPTKRKACRRRIVLDLSKELESLFPTPLVVDLGPGGKTRNVKQCSGNENQPDSKMWQWGEP